MNSSRKTRKTYIATALKDGDFEVLSEVYKELFPKLKAYIYKLSGDQDLAEDIAQETFFILWTKRENINAKLSVKNYLYKICYNEYLQHIRKLGKERAFLEEIKVTVYLEIYVNEEKKDSRLIKMRKTIEEELSPKCKEAFIASKYENLSYAEIANRMGISIKTVEVHISKAYSILRKKLVTINLFFF